MKNITAHMKIFNDKIAIDSPVRTIKTPEIIGFLTCPYIPPVTNFLVGLHGANVPLPILIIVDIVIVMIYNPMHTITSPDKSVEI